MDNSMAIFVTKWLQWENVLCWWRHLSFVTSFDCNLWQRTINLCASSKTCDVKRFPLIQTKRSESNSATAENGFNFSCLLKKSGDSAPSFSSGLPLQKKITLQRFEFKLSPRHLIPSFCHSKSRDAPYCVLHMSTDALLDCKMKCDFYFPWLIPIL